MKFISNLSVLLVDDNSNFLRMAKLFLAQLKNVAVVGTATGGEDGFKQALNLKPDIVCVDLNMPDLHGLDLIPKLRKALPETGIIALTMLDEDGYREASLAAGADAFISKEKMNADLPRAICRLADVREKNCEG